MLLGLVLLFVGVWVRSDPNFWEFQNNLPLENYYTACYLCIYAGALMLVISFMGCVGTFIDSPCILWTYMGFSGWFIVIECIIAGLVWQIPSGEAIRDDMEQEIKKRLLSIHENPDARRFMDLLQIHVECCGAVSKNDYTDNSLTIPQSCSNYRTNNVHIYGCGENLRVTLQRTGASLGGVSMALVFVQLISLSVNFLLLVNLQEEYGPKIY
ncbi:23 kDa integral membrane protein-like isoform X2 [Varroa jacobsoni]|uniref:Tetraspanin n=1 Tax=Varroa destructor TaxID=109461 RepID=A0A7M7J403_VARDE|nr:23 kDa integral membrane protein-like isoform X2 [Varroa destructor]XP_022699965.1 23 kDa integral membrane protein-like isoform X2 [Varroa jacobsoni]